MKTFATIAFKYQGLYVSWREWNQTLNDIFRDLIELYKGLNKKPMSFNGHLSVDSIGIKVKQNEMCIHMYNLKKSYCTIQRDVVP